MSPTADVILANRAYLDHDSPPGGDESVSAANGGLLAAVRRVIAPWHNGAGTTWIGVGRGLYDREWVDSEGYELLQTSRGGVRHRRLFFDDATWGAHYGAVANSFLWPMLHLIRDDLPRLTGYYPAPAQPSAAVWQRYHDVNQAFAAAAAAERPGAAVWVHDYQLALVPGMLRERRPAGRIGFFLHTPFPELDIVAPYLDATGLDYLRQFVEGILGADLAGFQSEGDVGRFERAARSLCGAELSHHALRYRGRSIATGVFPVGIDVEEVLEIARHARPPERFERLFGSGTPLVVGLERADFTKGIPERLRAIARAHREGGRFIYAGIASPTRAGIEVYDAFGEALDQAAMVAAECAHATGNRFIQTRAAITWPDVVALQRRADVIFTSSLADGLNLVPLQAAIAQSLRPPSERAVIITGRDAGVAHAFPGFEADGLVPVDPLDEEAMTTTLLEALDGRPGRISDRLIGEVRRRDALAWSTRFLEALEGTC